MHAETIFAYLKSLEAGPLTLAVAIILASFILEDAATIGAGMLVADGALSLSVAITALFVGILLGDLGLYGAGRLSARNTWVRRILHRRTAVDTRNWMGKRLFTVVISARWGMADQRCAG